MTKEQTNQPTKGPTSEHVMSTIGVCICFEKTVGLDQVVILVPQLKRSWNTSKEITVLEDKGNKRTMAESFNISRLHS